MQWARRAGYRRESFRRLRRGPPMRDRSQLISDAFQLFLKESPRHAQAWMTAVRGLAEASALDQKTQTLAYLTVLAALRLDRRALPCRPREGRRRVARRGDQRDPGRLPAAGNAVTPVLSAALRASDEGKCGHQHLSGTRFPTAPSSPETITPWYSESRGRHPHARHARRHSRRARGRRTALSGAVQPAVGHVS